MARTELKMQAHICASYELHGGYACKWDAAHAKGKPDLVCSLRGVGAHFLEVKHRPEVTLEKLGAIKNPMETRQITEAKNIIHAGGLVLGCLVIGGSRTVSDAALALFNPQSEVWYLGDAQWTAWDGKNKFDIPRVIFKWRTP